MKRRNFVKQSIAGTIISATPLALTGLVRADGGGGIGTTTTDSTDWWNATNTTDWWNATNTTDWWNVTNTTDWWNVTNTTDWWNVTNTTDWWNSITYTTEFWNPPTDSTEWWEGTTWETISTTAIDPEDWNPVCELKTNADGVRVPCRVIDGAYYCEAKCSADNNQNAAWGYVTCTAAPPHMPIRESNGCFNNWQVLPPEGW